MESKVPLSHTLWSPYDTVKDAAESLGINLPDEVSKNLAMDVEYRIQEILENAIKFMRHSKRKLLMTSDIEQSLKVLNIEPLYGYDTSTPLNFKEALVGAGQTLYYIDDNEIEFEKLINQPLPKIPRQTTFTAHWLAIEGVQPTIPQNPLPSEIKSIPAMIRGALPSNIGNDLLSNNSTSNSNNQDIEVKPLIKHVLSKELQLFFDRVIEVLISFDPEKFNLKRAALTSLSSDPGLHQLVPYFIQFIAEQISNNLRNVELLSTMLEVIFSLLSNKTIFLDPYVHALMPCVLTLLLAKRIGNNSSTGNSDEEASHFDVRDLAAGLLEHLCNQYGDAYSTLKPRVSRTLLRAFLDPSKPVGTHYGAIIGLSKLGNEVIKLILVGNLKAWSITVLPEFNESDQSYLLNNSILIALRNLKICSNKKDESHEESAHDKEMDENVTNRDPDKMEIDGNDSSSLSNDKVEITDDIISQLNQALGEKIAKLVLDQPDSIDIIRGIFFGEIIL